jgi:hypothetical protein
VGVTATPPASLPTLAGITVTPAAGAPTITINSPLPGQKVPANQPVLITSSAADPDGIQRTELWIDGAPTRIDVNPQPSSPYIVTQPWQTDKAGSHIIVVKAFDTQGTEGQSQPLAISVETGAPSTPIAHPSAAPGPASPTTVLVGVSPATVTVMPALPLPTWTATPLPPTSTPRPPTETPVPVCTPPACAPGEVFYCPGNCPGGCGTVCATPTPTATPPDYKPTGIDPHSVFKPVWQKPAVKDYIGYPTTPASADRRYARQYFERGYFYWWDRPNEPGLIWVVEMPDPDRNQGFHWSGPYEDTWSGGDSFACQTARDSRYGPRSGFGKLWCEHPEIAQAVGNARTPEEGTGESSNYGVVQLFQGGIMLYSPLDGEVWVLFTGGTWQRHIR